MNLYYVDCCDAIHWVLARSENKARDIAAQEVGHDDCNECLYWDETMWGRHYDNQDEVVAALRSMGESVL